MRTPREVAKTGSDAGSRPATMQQARVSPPARWSLEQLAQRDTATRLVVPLGQVARDRIIGLAISAFFGRIPIAMAAGARHQQAGNRLSASSVRK
jgi:hypothetical protein